MLDVSAFDEPSTNKQLIKIYRDCEYEMVNRNNYALQDLLGSAREKIPDLLKSGVYMVSCQSGCDHIYLGETERNLTVRFNEHLNNIESKDVRNGIARHMNEIGHITDISKVSLIEHVRSRSTRVFECVEKVHINENSDKNLMNLNYGQITSNQRG